MWNEGVDSNMYWNQYFRTEYKKMAPSVYNSIYYFPSIADVYFHVREDFLLVYFHRRSALLCIARTQ